MEPAGTLATGVLRTGSGDNLQCAFHDIGKKPVTISVTQVLGLQQSTADLLVSPARQVIRKKQQGD